MDILKLFGFIPLQPVLIYRKHGQMQFKFASLVFLPKYSQSNVQPEGLGPHRSEGTGLDVVLSCISIANMVPRHIFSCYLKQ